MKKRERESPNGEEASAIEAACQKCKVDEFRIKRLAVRAHNVKRLKEAVLMVGILPRAVDMFLNRRHDQLLLISEEDADLQAIFRTFYQSAKVGIQNCITRKEFTRLYRIVTLEQFKYLVAKIN